MSDATSTPGPFARHLGFSVLEATTARAVLEADPRPEHLNGGGIVHGGYLSSLLDSATGWAVHPHLAPGTLAPHVTLSVQYLRAATAGAVLTCEARVLRAGRRTAAAEAEVRQEGRLIAKATTIHAVLTPP